MNAILSRLRAIPSGPLPLSLAAVARTVSSAGTANRSAARTHRLPRKHSQSQSVEVLGSCRLPHESEPSRPSADPPVDEDNFPLTRLERLVEFFFLLFQPRFSVGDPRVNQTLPVDLSGEVLGHKIFVVRLDFLEIGPFAPLRVEIVGIEFAHPLEHAFILLIH